jgi:hypothetical protein
VDHQDHQHVPHHGRQSAFAASVRRPSAGWASQQRRLVKIAAACCLGHLKSI